MPTIQGRTRPVQMAVVPGAGVGVPLPKVGGINVGDTLIAAREISDDLVTNADVLANTTITDADEITVAVVDTTGNFVMVVWEEAE